MDRNYDSGLNSRRNRIQWFSIMIEWWTGWLWLIVLFSLSRSLWPLMNIVALYFIDCLYIKRIILRIILSIIMMMIIKILFFMIKAWTSFAVLIKLSYWFSVLHAQRERERSRHDQRQRQCHVSDSMFSQAVGPLLSGNGRREGDLRKNWWRLYTSLSRFDGRPRDTAFFSFSAC